MPQNATLFAFRLDPAVVDILKQLSARFGLPDAQTIERLIVDAGRAEHIVSDDDPNVAFFELLAWIKALALPAAPDVIRYYFERIQADPVAAKLHATAVRAPAGIAPEKRRQFVHARIGKFIKNLVGWESDRELVLPRNANLPIKGYTVLRPPAPPRRRATRRK